MQIALPIVTIIIPTRPGQTEIKAVEAARRLQYPREALEVLVARGTQPSIQRNRAVQEARGEVIYFLDDDSQPEAGALGKAVEHFRDPAVQMVGGPNLCPQDAPFLEQVFAVVLSSWIAFGPSRARYDRVGAMREGSEKELILCNLLARRGTLVELGGFDESLYPNEENALMDEIRKRGGRLIYDPDVVVHRRPRPTLKAFVRMLMTYGRGRAEQFRLHPTFGSALNFVPPLFVLFVLSSPLLAWYGWFDLEIAWFADSTPSGDPVQMTRRSAGLGLFPLLAYAAALLGQTVVNAGGSGIDRAVLALPLLFATHFFYGIGFWRGLFTRLRRAAPLATQVEIERIII